MNSIQHSTGRGSATGDDRRYSIRIPEQCAASVVLPNRRRVKGETVDLSSAGVCLTLPQALELGHEYEFHIDRRINEGQTQSIDVVGRVCFCISRGGQFRIGVHCRDLSLARILTELEPAETLTSELCTQRMTTLP